MKLSGINLYIMSNVCVEYCRVLSMGSKVIIVFVKKKVKKTLYSQIFDYLPVGKDTRCNETVRYIDKTW